MKKKLLLALLCVILSVSVVACSRKESESSESQKLSDETSTSPIGEIESVLEAETESKPDNTPDNDSVEISEKTLEDIETYLLEKGVLSGDRVQMGAELIGGIAGFKYKDSIGEIYEYDVDSEDYQKLASGESIPLNGMESYTIKAVSINGKFVLFGDGVSQEFIDAFNSFE